LVLSLWKIRHASLHDLARIAPRRWYLPGMNFSMYGVISGHEHASMNVTQQKVLIYIGFGAMILLSTWFGIRIHQLSNEYGTTKKEYSQVNNITNGLLSVEAWKENFMTVVNHQIDTFELSAGQADTVRSQIDKILHAVIDKADTLLDQKQETFDAKVKKMLIRMLINEDNIHEQVPKFSQTILDEVMKPENKAKLKKLVQVKLEEFGSSTYDSGRNDELTTAILARYNASDTEFNELAEARLKSLNRTTYQFTFALIIILILNLIVWWILKEREPLQKPAFILSVLLAIVVLIAGVTTPMIEIDARIDSLDFKLIGTDISFDNQVIFFQSKSIMDVIMILIQTGKLDAVFVGILILVFSVVFPIAKLLSTAIFLMGGPRWTGNKVISFFALQSSKWSMADVHVIAIFMAYIGFKGILDDQLSHLNIQKETLTAISTNHTALQPGYIVFLGFVLYGFILSLILDRITASERE
jgi:hypothetical protein